MLNKEDAAKASYEYFNGNKLAADTFVKKYALKDKNNNYHESTPADMHQRLAREFNRIDKKYHDINKHAKIYSTKEYFDALDKFARIVPQGSPMAAIGNKFSKISASNCFVIDAAKYGDSMSGILATINEAVEIMKRRGGVGLDVSTYRPRGSTVHNAAVSSSGVPTVCDAISFFGRYVGQNARQGALMITISDRHPDVIEFAKMKADRTKVTGANVSIKISNDLIDAVEKDEDWELRWPVTGTPQITKVVKAKELWDVIVTQAWENAEPGLLMWDNYCNNLPAHCYKKFGFETLTTNPCYTGDTRINTDYGLLTVKELQQINKELYVTYDPRVSKDGTVDITKYSINTLAVKSSKVQITGENEVVYQVKLCNGQLLKVTASHNHFTTDGKKTTKELKIGDTLLIQSIEGKFGKNNYIREAALAGWVIGDGTTSTGRVYLHFYDELDIASELKPHLDSVVEEYNKSSRPYKSVSLRRVHMESCNTNCTTEKYELASNVLFDRFLELGYDAVKLKHQIPEFIWSSDKESVAAFLRSLFSADGSVQVNESKKSISVRLASINKKLLRDVQILLSNFAIPTSIRRFKKKGKRVWLYRGEERLYNQNACYELIIGGGYFVKLFRDKIGFIQSDNNKIVDEWCIKHPGSNNTESSIRNKYLSKITSIKKMKQRQTVYCLNQPYNHSVLANGVISGNCAEIGLSAYDSCRLISINLAGYVLNPFTKNATFDLTNFINDVHLAMQMEDNLVDLEIEIIDKILSDLEKDKDDAKLPFSIQKDLWNKIKEAAINGRRTGLGTHGFADCLMALNIPYNKSDDMVEVIYQALRNEAYKKSVKLAQDRGAFPMFDWDLEKDCAFIKRLPKEIQNDIEKFGRRNISLLTIAPTGTVSLLSKTSCGRFGTSSGMEPVYDFVYVRKVKITSENDAEVHSVDHDGSKYHHYPVFHNQFLDWAEANGFNIVELEKLVAKSTKPASEALRDAIGNLPDFLKVTASNLNIDDRLRIVSKIQSYIDHGVSQTCNFPKGTPKDTIDKFYRDACHHGLKGVTVYVDGSRNGILVSEESKVVKNSRPGDVECDIHRSNGHIVLVGLVNGQVYEVFAGKKEDLPVPSDITKGIIRKLEPRVYALVFPVSTHTGKSRIVEWPIKESFLQSDGMTVRLLTNLAIRSGVNLEDICDTVFKSADMNSFSRHVARVLSNYIKNAKCSEGCCGTPNIIYEDGCKKCLNCAWSKCQ